MRAWSMNLTFLVPLLLLPTSLLIRELLFAPLCDTHFGLFIRLLGAHILCRDCISSQQRQKMTKIGLVLGNTNNDDFLWWQPPPSHVNPRLFSHDMPKETMILRRDCLSCCYNAFSYMIVLFHHQIDCRLEIDTPMNNLMFNSTAAWEHNHQQRQFRDNNNTTTIIARTMMMMIIIIIILIIIMTHGTPPPPMSLTIPSISHILSKKYTTQPYCTIFSGFCPLPQ